MTDRIREFLRDRREKGLDVEPCLVVDLDGEDVRGLAAVIGYLHTGFEKTMEQKTYWKAIPYVPRMDYLSFFSGETAFCMATEKALELEPNNTQIRQNYDLFKEINDRAAQKDGRQ